MAADNYSDVVQALAQQIVSTCLKLINTKAPSLISTANIDASQITGDTSVIGGGGGGYGGIVTVDNVVGLNNAIANAIATSQIDVSQIVRFDENVGLVIKDASISTAQIDKLEARVADIAKAHISDADIDWAKIQNLSAAVATIANTEIGNATIDTANIDWANIDWANIRNSVTDRAIITQGVSGQLYIADLAVTEANMVSLSVGELMVKGRDGYFYSVSVDNDGNIVTTKKEIDTGDIADNAIKGDKIANNAINGGTKIIENSITASRLNVQDIFADNAIIKELMAQNIDVDTLFAREATISKLNTMDITGNQYLQMYVGNTVGDAILNITPDSIAAKVMSSESFQNSYANRDEIDEAIDGIAIGGRNYIRNSKDLILDGVHELLIVMDMDAVGYAIVGVSRVQ